MPDEGQVVELDGSRAGGDSGNRGERLFLEDNEDIVHDLVYILRIKRIVTSLNHSTANFFVCTLKNSRCLRQWT